MNRFFLLALLLLPFGILRAQVVVSIGETVTLNQNIYINGTVMGLPNGAIKTDNTVVVTGDWINNADENFLSGENTVILRNETATQSLGGNAKTVFYNLTVENKAGVWLAQDVDIANALTLSAGSVDLQKFHINLGSTGTLVGENSTNRVLVSNPMMHIGTISATVAIDNVAKNPGNLGIEIHPTGNMGNVTVTRGHYRQQGSSMKSDTYGISRFFDISPDNQVTSNLKFYYLPEELTLDHPEEELIMYHWVDHGSGYFWEAMETVINTDEKYVEVTTHSFSKFTLGSENNPLPVELIHFGATWNPESEHVRLDWQTASEINSDRFEIYRSSGSMLSWEKIHSTSAAGNSTQIVSYTAFDNSAPAGVVYYRLKQMDLDGAFEYSHIVTVTVPVGRMETVFDIDMVYPNPATVVLNVSLKSSVETAATLYVWDASGKMALQEKISVVKGKNHIPIHVGHLASASYTVQVISKEQNWRSETRFVKN